MPDYKKNNNNNRLKGDLLRFFNDNKCMQLINYLFIPLRGVLLNAGDPGLCSVLLSIFL